MSITEQDWDTAQAEILKAMLVGDKFRVRFGREMLVSTTPPEHIADGQRAFETITERLSLSRFRQEGVHGRPGLKPAWLSLVEAIEIAALTGWASTSLAPLLGLPIAEVKKGVDEIRTAVGLSSPKELTLQAALLLVFDVFFKWVRSKLPYRTDGREAVQNDGGKK
jgi:hypothetical protein